MTNREAHEQAAGMPLDDIFFKVNRIDPDAEYIEPKPRIRASVNLNEKDRINIDDGEKALIVNLIDGIRINFCPICGREFKNDI